MCKASEKEEEKQCSSDKTYSRTKCEVFVRFFLALYKFRKSLQTLKGDSGDEGHDDEFVPMPHGHLYGSHRNGFATHHTCACQYSWLIKYASFSGRGAR
jgi:hypothetical protein